MGNDWIKLGPTTIDQLQEYFDYLTELRNGGTMNMLYGPSALRGLYGMSRPEASAVWVAWTDAFGKGGAKATKKAVDALNEKFAKENV